LRKPGTSRLEIRQAEAENFSNLDASCDGRRAATWSRMDIEKLKSPVAQLEHKSNSRRVETGKTLSTAEIRDASTEWMGKNRKQGHEVKRVKHITSKRNTDDGEEVH
jgi:hypothetical protein